MSRLARIRALLLALALVPWIAAAADSSPVAVATELLDRLDQGEYEAATERFTTELKEAVSGDQLRQIWQVLPGQVGARQGRGDASVTAHGGMTAVLVPLRHVNATVNARIAVDSDGRIAGFLVQLAPPPPAVAPAANAGFVERDWPGFPGDRGRLGSLAHRFG